MTKYSPLLLSTLFLTACGDPLIGEWEGRTSSFGSTDVEIEIEAKGEGEVTARDTGYRYKGRLDWEKTERREYEIEESCREIMSNGVELDCVEEDNTWHCEMDEKDELECTLEYEDGSYELDLDGSRFKFKFRRKDKK